MNLKRGCWNPKRDMYHKMMWGFEWVRNKERMGKKWEIEEQNGSLSQLYPLIIPPLIFLHLKSNHSPIPPLLSPDFLRLVK